MMTENRQSDIDLDELDLPYHFDLLLFDNIKSPDLLEHIRTAGTTIYRRTSALYR